MEIKKNVQLSYRIEEKPGGGYVARSDDPSQETIEAANKLELFQKMRDRTVAVLGSEIPLDLEHLRISTRPAAHGAVINIATKQPQEVAPPAPPQMAAARTVGWNWWKIAFFLLLGTVMVVYFLHR